MFASVSQSYSPSRFISAKVFDIRAHVVDGKSIYSTKPMSFSSSFFLALVVFATLCDTSPVMGSMNTDSCETHISPLETCNAVVSTSGDCQSSTINLTNTEYAQCSSNNFFWSYPMKNMTFIIETPLTQSRQGYIMYLDNVQLSQGISRVFRLFNNQETEVTTRGDKLIQYSDTNYQIVLKFEGPDRLSRYGVVINYQTVPMS
jgi:hypothetical protein